MKVYNNVIGINGIKVIDIQYPTRLVQAILVTVPINHLTNKSFLPIQNSVYKMKPP